MAKECNDVPKEDCTYEEIKCENVDEEVCDTIPREVCQDVTKNECRSVPREDCQVKRSLQLGSQSIFSPEIFRSRDLRTPNVCVCVCLSQKI